MPGLSEEVICHVYYHAGSSRTRKGCTQSVTPESAGWGYVGFRAYELQEGQQLTLPAVSEERCLVLVAGRATSTTPGGSLLSSIGERMSPFERIKPWAV